MKQDADHVKREDDKINTISEFWVESKSKCRDNFILITIRMSNSFPNETCHELVINTNSISTLCIQGEQME